ncbi:hypothetical protein TNCV_1207261 [Trichonephila clavipes]|nr:hypothetical protein TNCV_1207261 [Trichonephila clavipes]
MVMSETHSAKNESLEKPANLLQIRKPEEKFQKSMENLPRIAYQMEYFQLEMVFLSLQAPIMIPYQYT